MIDFSNIKAWKFWEMRASWICLLLSPLFLLLIYGKSQSTRQFSLNPAVIDDFISRQMVTQRGPGLALALNLADSTAASHITIRQLLNHTSGLSETGFPDMQLPQPETIEERVTSLRGARQVARHGTEYHYFNPNYATLARVVEVVSGQPFSEYLEAHIFVPLAMKHTLSVVTSTEGKQKADHLAQGHLVAFGIPFSYPEVDGYLGGSGGVISTAEDMAHYLIAQNTLGRYLDQELVTPEAVVLMHTPPAKIDSTYAMGWTEGVLDGMRILLHNGVISTYCGVGLLPD